MEETKWLTKTKIIILISLVVLTGLIIGSIFIRRNVKIKEYKKYESQLEYAAPNYLLKERINLKENEWREINVKDILKQKLLVNKNSSDCDGYVIAQGLKDNSTTSDESIQTDKNVTLQGNQENQNEEDNKTLIQPKEEEKYTSNITYKAYIKCKNIYVTDGYGTKSATGTQNTKKTQSQNDTEKPKITLFGDSTITLEVGDSYKELGAMAIDNIDKDISNKIKISGEVDTTKVGTYKVKYTVSDSSNNKSSITRTVIVKENENSEKNKKETKDVTKPQIEFSNPNAYQRICTGDKVDISINGAYGYVARDDVDGDITPSVRVTGQTGVINIVGTYTLTYEVSDKAGNKTSVQRNFEVKSCSPTPTPTPVPTPTPTPTPTPQPTPTPTPTPQPPEQPTIPDTDPNVPVTNLIVTPSAKTISIGNTYQLTVSIIPSNATNKTLTYTTSNSRVATVTSNGLIRGISKGTAEIRVTSSNGKVGKCNITVQ